MATHWLLLWCSEARALPAEDAAAETLTLLMASMALGWVFGPVLIGGVDETIDPTKLALLPMSSTERYVVQLAAAMTGTGPLAAATGLCVGLTIGHTRLGISLFVVPLAAICAVFLMVGAARSLAALLAIAQRSRVWAATSPFLPPLLPAVRSSPWPN